MKTDVIVDLQYGDCAKGKVAHHLCKSGKYSHVLRYNGGCNAGHTIYHNGTKFITHHIPAGVFFGIKSIIGPGCVVDPEKFFEELQGLKDGGVQIEGKIYIAKNTHIITAEHKGEDKGEAKIGTTQRGNGPAYRDKYARTGKRAEDIEELKPYLIDLYEEFHNKQGVNVLCEGAQGFGLDIDWGVYPYVTSSHPTVAGALLNGIPYSAVNEVWGVAKIYETYVGARKFEPDDKIFDEIRKAGEEFGATTGRPRQCNWLNMDTMKRAIQMNGVTHLVISKMDVLRQVGKWAVIDNETIFFDSEEKMKDWLLDKFSKLGLEKENVFFSENKDRI